VKKSHPSPRATGCTTPPPAAAWASWNAADERWDALTPADRAWVRARPEIHRTFAGGIGGTADFTRIKCLHLHWAHHLAVGGTTAGRLIEAIGGVTE